MKIEGTATIYDVANEAGVSITTVSRYLNKASLVGAETRTKIQQAMDRLGYVPQAEAQMRSRKSLKRIGVLTPFFPAPSFVARLQGVASGISHTQNELIIYTVYSKEQLQEYLALLPVTNRIDGLIIMSMALPDEDSRRLIRSKLPTVLIEFNNGLFSCVEADNIEGGRQAARYLLDKGYYPMALLGEASAPPYSIHPCDQRVQGAKEVLSERGLELKPRHDIVSSFSFEDSKRAAVELLSGPDRPRSVFAVTDLQAIGVYKAAMELSLRVPEDVAILGFDDLEEAMYLDLSTISQKLVESGRAAAEMLLSLLEDADRPPRHIRLATEIIERKTT